VVIVLFVPKYSVSILMLHDMKIFFFFQNLVFVNLKFTLCLAPLIVSLDVAPKMTYDIYQQTLRLKNVKFFLTI
jgi:hypothetical protein